MLRFQAANHLQPNTTLSFSTLRINKRRLHCLTEPHLAAKKNPTSPQYWPRHCLVAIALQHTSPVLPQDSLSRASAMRETTVESHLITSTLSHTIENINTPPIISPPRSKTPPLAITKRNAVNGQMAGHERAASESLDPVVLSRALKEFEDGGRQRERTPGGSPSRKKQKVYGDRFIPNREGQDLQASFSLLHDDGSPATPPRAKKRTPHGELHFQKST